MEKESLDPRVNRMDHSAERQITAEREHFQTYEVFHQKKRGDHAVHVGIVHAPNAEMALVFAKEQFGRRQKTADIWVVASVHVYTLKSEDEDMFYTTPEKTYREASGYSVRDKIAQFKKENLEA